MGPPLSSSEASEYQLSPAPDRAITSAAPVTVSALPATASLAAPAALLAPSLAFWAILIAPLAAPITESPAAILILPAGAHMLSRPIFAFFFVPALLFTSDRQRYF